MGRTVAIASLLVRFAASTRSARCDATKRVLRVSKRARGLVTIKGLARCPVQLLATGYRAISAVRDSFLVVISALECAERRALMRTAISVP